MSSYRQTVQSHCAAPARSTSGRGGLRQEVSSVDESYKLREAQRRAHNNGHGPLPPELHRTTDEARRYVREMGMPGPVTHRDLAQEQASAQEWNSFRYMCRQLATRQMTIAETGVRLYMSGTRLPGLLSCSDGSFPLTSNGGG